MPKRHVFSTSNRLFSEEYSLFEFDKRIVEIILKKENSENYKPSHHLY